MQDLGWRRPGVFRRLLPVARHQVARQTMLPVVPLRHWLPVSPVPAVPLRFQPAP
jgi:hypothetical protein